VRNVEIRRVLLSSPAEAADLGLLNAVFLTPGEDADFDGNAIVNFMDLAIMKAFFFKPPGPGGIVARHAPE
jgi:hypothetical protein